MERPSRNRTRTTTSRTRAGMRKNRSEASWYLGQNNRVAERRRTVSPKTPPVLVRSHDAAGNPMAGVSPAKKTRSRKVRRRFDFSLNAAGAEIRLPSLPAIRASTRLISLAFVLVLSILIFHFWNSPLYKPEEAQVSGLKRLKSSDVNAVLNLSDAPIFSLDPAQIKQELLSAFPEFSDVAVSVALPRSVKIEVSERIPVMTWRQGDRTELIDAAGFAFPMRIEATTLITPVVEAYGDPPGMMPIELEAPLSELAISEEVKQAANQLFFGNAKANKTVYARKLLSPDMVSAIRTAASLIPANMPLIYEATHGLGWRDERGWQVYLGDGQEIEMKIKVYETLIQQLASAGIQPILVSVEHVHNPYYRLEP
jgi:hypothetical protein